MAVELDNLSVVMHPAEVLREKAERLGEVTDETRGVGRRMVELMREADGIGLAAPQVGLAWRLFVCHVPVEFGDEDEPESFQAGPEFCIDPEIVERSDNLVRASEGCLSLPDVHGDVIRPDRVTMRYTNLDGERVEMRASGLLARCVQHEFDHLDGVLIIDRMTQSSRLKNRSVLRDLERLKGAR